MICIFFTFPRRIATSERFTVNSLGELEQCLKNYNGKNNLYIEIYKDNLIDKIYFDIDGVEKLPVAIKFHEYCKEKNLKHCVLFSGRGYHVYIKANGKSLKNSKSALSNAHTILAHQLGLKWGDPKSHELDFHIRGNLAQIARLPFTVNIRTDGRRCVYLSEEMLSKGVESIIEYSKSNEKDVFVYGDKSIEMDLYDTTSELKYEMTQADYDSAKDIKEIFPDCIKNMLRNPELRYLDRGNLILYCRRIGFKPAEIYALLKKYLTAEKYLHCSKDERQVEYLCKTNEYFFMHSKIENRYCFKKDCEASKLYKRHGDKNGG